MISSEISLSSNAKVIGYFITEIISNDNELYEGFGNL